MVKEIENLKNIDDNYWRVYGLGLPGQIKGWIFDNWDVVDEIPENCKWVVCGMDFGFTNDPTALINWGWKVVNCGWMN